MNRLQRAAAALAALMTIAMATPAMAEGAPDPVGDWSGVLTTPRGALTLIVHVARDAKGALAATLESPDQGPGTMPASEFAAGDGHLAWKIAAIGASYKGDWDAAKNRWQGTFTQGADLPLVLTRGLPPPRPTVKGLDGRWEGAIAVNGVNLRLVVRIATGERGTAANLDSPDQLAYGIPMSNLTHDGQAVSYDVPAVKAHYAGTLSADGSRIEGSWTQPGLAATPVTFALNRETAKAG
ncbi:MAG: hypothetical protein J2O44_00145, partial [Porphyrobacter sp.]|nr:hypothetical protein [Porphyrobacter sp.]